MKTSEIRKDFLKVGTFEIGLKGTTGRANLYAVNIQFIVKLLCI